MPGANGRPLDRGLAVALDERDDDVLAPQAGQQVGRRGRAIRVGATSCSGKSCRSLAAAAILRTSVAAKPVVEPRGDRRVRRDVDPQRRAADPDQGQRTDGPRRPAPVGRADPGHPGRGPGQQADTATASSTAPATSAYARAGPTESRRTPMAGPRLLHSMTGLKARSSSS